MKTAIRLKNPIRGNAAVSARFSRRSLVITVLATVVLLLLAASVYTVAVRARNVSTKAQEAHSVGEILRISAIVRADVTVAAGYRVLATDADIESAFEASAASAIAGLETIEAALKDQSTDSAPTGDIQSAGREFIVRTTEYLEALKTISSATESTAVRQGEQAYIDAFTRFNRALVDQRGEALEALRDSNGAMNRVGTVAGFVIAFVVPATGLYIFESLRRLRQEMLLARRRIRRMTRGQLDTASAAGQHLDAVGRATDGVLEALESGRIDTAARSLHNLRTGVERGRHQLAVMGAQQKISLEYVDLLLVLRQALATAGMHGTNPISELSRPQVVADPDALRRVLVEMARSAAAGGAEQVRVDVIADPTVPSSSGNALVQFTDSGPGLADEAVQAIFRQATPEHRDGVAAGQFGFGLPSARGLATALGGDLRYARTPQGQSVMTLSLPLFNGSNPVHEDLDAQSKAPRPISP